MVQPLIDHVASGFGPVLLPPVAVVAAEGRSSHWQPSGHQAEQQTGQKRQSTITWYSDIADLQSSHDDYVMRTKWTATGARPHSRGTWLLKDESCLNDFVPRPLDPPITGRTSDGSARAHTRAAQLLHRHSTQSQAGAVPPAVSPPQPKGIAPVVSEGTRSPDVGDGVCAVAAGPTDLELATAAAGTQATGPTAALPLGLSNLGQGRGADDMEDLLACTASAMDHSAGATVGLVAGSVVDSSKDECQKEPRPLSPKSSHPPPPVGPPPPPAAASVASTLTSTVPASATSVTSTAGAAPVVAGPEGIPATEAAAFGSAPHESPMHPPGLQLPTVPGSNSTPTSPGPASFGRGQRPGSASSNKECKQQ